MSSKVGLRTRWAAIGAACAVSLCGGGFGLVKASISSGDRAIYVPVTPIRILDTRSRSNVVNDTIRLVIEGIITTADGTTQQVVPTDATAVAINITATEARKAGDYGYVTVFPCTSKNDPVPNASSLNFESGVDIANALIVSTSVNGSVCLYVFGSTELLVDLSGYYTNHTHDDRYYTKLEIDAALSSKANSADVDAAIDGLNTAVTGKANLGDVEAELDGFGTVLAGKANLGDVEAALNRKANKCEFGGNCAIGNIGPSGGIVYIADNTNPIGSQVYEVSCAGWSDGDCGGVDLTDPTMSWDAAITTCENLVIGGKSDWRLPGTGELHPIYAKLQTVGLGSFTSGGYWSSLAQSTWYAWFEMFDVGGQVYTWKINQYSVRCIRTF